MKVRLIFTILLFIACLFTAVRCFNHLNAWLGFLFVAIAAFIGIHELIYYITKNNQNETN